MTEMETIFLKSSYDDLQYCDPIKCAEVFRNVTGSFLYVCLICSKREENSIMLENHLVNHFINHVNRYAENNTHEIDIKQSPNQEEQKENNINPVDNNISDHHLCEKNSNGKQLEETKQSDELLRFQIQQNKPTENAIDSSINKTLIHVNNKPEIDLNSSSESFDETNTVNEPKLHKQCKQKLPHKCTDCPELFRTKRHLQIHRKVHKKIQPKEERPFACEICSARFKNSNNLKIHGNVHSNERPYKCDICNKCFTNENYAKIHRRTHTGDLPFQCDQCGLAFNTKKQLNIHVERRHSITPKYTCSICSQNFKIKEALRNHIIRHNNIKAHKCSECSSTFFTKKELQQHSYVHLAEKQFPCFFCEMKFSQWTGRRAHEKRVHKIL